MGELPYWLDYGVALLIIQYILSMVVFILFLGDTTGVLTVLFAIVM